jgi:chromosome segregation ATPase
MKTIPDADETAKQINQALDDNAALKAKVAQLEEENARLRKHMELQQREMEALQAEHSGAKGTLPGGDAGGRVTAPAENHGAAASEEVQKVMAQLRRLGR